MGASGPLRLPQHLRPVADGEKAGTAAETVRRAAPERPASSEVADLWGELVPALDEAGLLAECDGPVLELMLEHYRLAKLAAGEVQSAAVRDHTHGGLKKHPAEAVFRAESDMFLRYAQQLGMTFVSRARTQAPAREASGGGGGNPFDSEAPTGS